MRRREFISLLGGAATAWPLGASAQQATHLRRIGYLRRSPPRRADFEALIAGLRALGWELGRNIHIEPRHADGDHRRLAPLAAELAALNVEVIVVDGRLTIDAARSATGPIPIVFALGGGDVVADGLIKSLARPGGNITGLTMAGGRQLPGKRLEILRELLPGLTRVGLLYNPDNLAMDALDAALADARILGLAVDIMPVKGPAEWESAFVSMRQKGIAAVLQLPDATFASENSRIAELALRQRLPVIYAESEFARAGGLISYGVNVPDLFRRAAAYVDKILKGAKPGDLPVEQPTTYELVINLKTAKALGITIPNTLLAQADDVIE